MIVIEKVQGSKELAVPLIIQKTTVYVKENIHKVETDDNTEMYEWDETQYDKDEYLELMQSEVTKLYQKDLDNKMALIELYEMVANK